MAQRSRMVRNKQAALQRRADLIAARRGTLPTLTSSFPMAPRPGVTATGLFNARAMGIEKKFIDSTQPIAALAGSAILLMNGSATGDDFNNRNGREIKMKSLYLRITGANTVDQESCVRVMLVYDKQPNGNTPAITDVLVSADVNAANNLNNKERFITISDKVYTCSTAAKRSWLTKKYKRLDTSTQYSGTGATVASIATGALFLILIPQNLQNGASTGNYTIGYNCRIRFTDQ